MYENEDHCADFKSLSLQLYYKNVLITLKEGTDSFKSYGAEIEGKLIGRLWGSIIEKEEKKETVVALNIETADKELLIPCSEILSLAETVL